MVLMAFCMHANICMSFRAISENELQLGSTCHRMGSRFTIYGDACPLSCVNAEACLSGWPNA